MATLGCIRGKMGRTTYYICKMAAGELIDKVGVAGELPEWPDMTIEEKSRESVISDALWKRSSPMLPGIRIVFFQSYRGYLLRV